MAEYITVDKISYEVRRNARRKRIAIGVDGEGQFFIASPQQTPRSELEALLRENGEDFRRRVMRGRAPESFAAHSYLEGEKFYFQGEQYPLRFAPPGKGPALSFEGGEFICAGEAEKEEIANRFELWYRCWLSGAMRKELPPLCKKIGVGPLRVSLKNVRTLWGSCSSLNNITFSIRLALVPPPLREYVMIHELCHMIEMNHSDRFWNEVAKYCPDYAERRKELKRDGSKYKW